MGARRQRCLVVLGRAPAAGMFDDIAAGRSPRQDFLEIAAATDARIVSADDVAWLPWRAARRLAKPAAAVAAFLRRSGAAAMYATGEDIGLPLAVLLRLVCWRGRLVVVVHACRGRSRKLFARLGHRPFHRLVCVSQAQVDTLLEIGFPAAKLLLQPAFADTAFFAPEPGSAGDMIFACGMESRDYDTLIAACGHLPQRLVILASGMMAADSAGVEARAAALGARVTVLQRIPFAAVRALYAEAALVVVPLHPAGYGAGVNGIVEAMAMGRAVIATNSPGIAEYLDPAGIVGVAPYDPQALAEAIGALLAQPQRLAAMGAHNRAVVEARYPIEHYVQAMVELLAGPSEQAGHPAPDA